MYKDKEINWFIEEFPDLYGKKIKIEPIPEHECRKDWTVIVAPDTEYAEEEIELFFLCDFCFSPKLLFAGYLCNEDGHDGLTLHHNYGTVSKYQDRRISSVWDAAKKKYGENKDV